MASKPKKRARSGTKGKAPARRPAARKKPPARRKRPQRPPLRPLRSALRWLRRMLLLAVAILLIWVSAYAFLNPPATPYMLAEKRRLGEIDQEWVPLSEIAPVMARAVVAAEDANFCTHWGFDMSAIRAAVADGRRRGGSTITQQVVKNAFLWQGRSWPRKALEAVITPVVELVWSKRRILEVYLNIIEFDEGVFGVEAAARHYFDVGPEALTARQAALLAMVLPNPKARSASRPTPEMAARARRIEDGAATIRKDGRAACFED